MDDLRLIGVDEDGRHLLLSDGDGSRYRVPLDEPLRAAARHDRPRLGQLQIEMGDALRPREVQALIRRGLSTEEVAERAGWTVEKVRKFEVPILAERGHVAERGRACAVGTRGSGPLSLEERVVERLRERGVERDHIDWDSARDEDGVWHLTMTFAAGGRRRTATWHYEPLGGSVTPTDDEARWLSEEATGGVIPAPHRAPPGEGLDVYDVDADGGLEPLARTGASRTSRSTSWPRCGSTAPGAPGPTAFLPLPHARRRPAPRRRPPTRGARDRPVRAASSPTRTRRPPGRDPPRPGVRGPGLEPPAGQADVDGPAESQPTGADEDEETPPAARRAASGRRGRPSVPSWDDIVFGTKGSGPA